VTGSPSFVLRSFREYARYGTTATTSAAPASFSAPIMTSRRTSLSLGLCARSPFSAWQTATRSPLTSSSARTLNSPSAKSRSSWAQRPTPSSAAIAAPSTRVAFRLKIFMARGPKSYRWSAPARYGALRTALPAGTIEAPLRTHVPQCPGVRACRTVYPSPSLPEDREAVMTVGTICNRNVATIDPDADITEAAERMRREHVGDLIVAKFKDARLVPVGIVTDRDIVISVVAKKVDPTTLTVCDVMSADLLTVREDNGIDFALREMRRFGVRRVPVIGTAGELVGVLSINDVVDYLGVQLSHIGDIIRFSQEAEAEKRP